MDEQIYYHFLSSQFAIEDLTNKWIKVSALGELNDPFELEPYLRFPYEGRQQYHEVSKHISKKWGLLCFSKNWRETVLWSYYAEKHKGIAIGFNILQGEVLKVRYTSYSKRQKIELTNDINIDAKLFLDLAKVKYKKWKYENEHRILVELKECLPKDCLTEECLPPKVPYPYFIKFEGRLKVREIVLGCRFNHKKEKENIGKLAIKLDAKIIPTREEWQGYKINKDGELDEMYKNLMSSMKLKNNTNKSL